MFMTVGDLCAAIGDDARVLAGSAGLGRCVRSSAVWHMCGESALCVIAVLYEAVTLELVREANQQGTAGLALLHGSDSDRALDDEVLREADKLLLPIVSLPAGYDEHRLAALALSENLGRHEMLIEGILQLHRIFVRDFDRTGFNAVADLLARRLHRCVALVDRGDEILGHAAYASDQEEEFENVLGALPMSVYVRDESIPAAASGYSSSEELLTVIRRVPIGEGNLVRYVPVEAQGSVTGAMVIWPGGPALSSAEAVGLSIAATVGSLEMLKDKAEKDAERRNAHQLVEDLLSGARDTKASLMRRASMLGWDLNGVFSVLVIETGSVPGPVSAHVAREWLALESDRVVTVIRRIASDNGLCAITAVRSDEVIVLLRHSTGARAAKDLSLKLGRAVASVLNSRQSGMHICVGIGQPGADASSLATGYQEAKKALSIGRAIGRAPVVHFDDLGIYRIIGKCADRSELESFVREKLGALIDYDTERGTCLVETLRVYFESASSTAAAARALFVHGNTVKQRLSRISQISGLDLSSTDDQFTAYLAVKILDFLQA